MSDPRRRNAAGVPVVLVSGDYLTRVHWRFRERLPMWVIYRPTTREYPGRWVARMHVTLPEPKPTRFVISHDTLDDLRTILPYGLTNIGRKQADLPEIEEVWL